jgi:hypothetical protein
VIVQPFGSKKPRSIGPAKRGGSSATAVAAISKIAQIQVGRDIMWSPWLVVGGIDMLRMLPVIFTDSPCRAE